MSIGSYENSSFPRTITLRLRIPAFVVCCIVLLVVVGWSFVLGIMVGRDIKADEDLGPLASLWPDMNTPMPNALLDGQDLPGEDEVIKTEDLQYKATLQATTPSIQSQQQPQTSAGKSANAPQQNQPTAGAPQQGVKPAQTAAGQNAAASSSQPQSATLFDYVFQVASFDRQNMAQDLMRKLNQAGLSCRMEEFKAAQGATWYRVLIQYRGGSDLSPLNAKLAPFKLSAPLLRKRAEVLN